LLIVVGLISSAIFSPITDRHKHYLGTTKILVPIIAATYIAFVFAPASRTIAVPCVIAALLGASSFALLPVILEYLVEITYPMSPEIGSTICWTGGQLFGAIFIIVENALKAGPRADPPQNMTRALIFQAVIAAAAVPFPLSLGLFGREVRMRRFEAERHRTRVETNNESVSRPSVKLFNMARRR
jgi:MFS family permease